jgi:hypothetical protein
MLFLLMQITCHPDGQCVGVRNPWTEYVNFLPIHIPVPTMWSEEETMMLTGTSLQVCRFAFFNWLRFILNPLSSQLLLRKRVLYFVNLKNFRTVPLVLHGAENSGGTIMI